MNYDHLLALATPSGIFEHCSGQTPLPEHGFCVDDVARALIVIARDPSPPAEVDRIADTCMDFLAASQYVDGSIDNRRGVDGAWSGEPALGDHWGRALWAWGTVVGRSSDLDRIERAVGAFRLSSSQRSPHLRSMAHAALGSAEYLRRFPTSTSALDLLADTRNLVLQRRDPRIPWPESRLTYANAVIPQAVIAAGLYLEEMDTLEYGLDMLEWLTRLQTPDGHLSPIGNGGWSPGDPLPAFDQQPLEVAHLVDACLMAFEATSDSRWLDLARRGAMWFYGINDVGAWMHDPKTGAGFDGLTPGGINPNCGAESTLAYLSTVGQLTTSLDALRVH
ncbi:MAG: hypothetical protein RL134_671 [Actinomycetota bacterium]